MNTFGQIQKQSLADLLRSGHRFTPQEISVLMKSAARSLAVRHKTDIFTDISVPRLL